MTKNHYETDIIDVFNHEIRQLGIFDYQMFHNAFCRRDIQKLGKILHALYEDTFDGVLSDIEYLFKYKILLFKIVSFSDNLYVDAFETACEALCTRDFVTLGQIFRTVSFQRLFDLIRTCYAYSQKNTYASWLHTTKNICNESSEEEKISTYTKLFCRKDFQKALQALQFHKFEQFIEIATKSFFKK